MHADDVPTETGTQLNSSEYWCGDIWYIYGGLTQLIIPNKDS